MACFHILGICPASSEVSYSFASAGLNSGAIILRRRGGMPSGPDALFAWRDNSSFSIPFSLMVIGGILTLMGGCAL